MKRNRYIVLLDNQHDYISVPFHMVKIIDFQFHPDFSTLNRVKTSFVSVFTYRKSSNVSYETRDIDYVDYFSKFNRGKSCLEENNLFLLSNGCIDHSFLHFEYFCCSCSLSNSASSDSKSFFISVSLERTSTRFSSPSFLDLRVCRAPSNVIPFSFTR